MPRFAIEDHGFGGRSFAALTHDDGPALGSLGRAHDYAAFSAWRPSMAGEDFGVDRRLGGDYVGSPQLSSAIPEDTSSGETLAIGGSRTGSIDFKGDGDYYQVTLVAGQNYVFTMTGSGGAPLADAFLELYDGDGTLLALDDDAGPGTSSLLRWTATDSGVFFINARGYEDIGVSNTGGYTVSAAIGAAQNPLKTIDLGVTAPPGNLFVYFAGSGASNPFGDTGMKDWTPAEIASVFEAFATISAVTTLTFTQTSVQADAYFVLQLSDLETNVLGYVGISGGVAYGAFDPLQTSWTLGRAPGGSGFVTLIHEIGHGLGLAHPHDNGGNSEVMQGVTSEFDSYGTFGLNQGIYTTMTYNDGYPALQGQSPNTFGQQATPMALDIALLQQKYGAKATAHGGSDVYDLPTGSSTGTFYSAIWDTGGVDEIRTFAAGGATIDLRPATLQNAVGGGGYVSMNLGTRGGFTIAAGVIIENATGGSGADTITGNDVANALQGNGGADMLQGRSGADTLIGGAGNDFLYGEDSSGVLLTANALTVSRLYLATLDRAPDPVGWAAWTGQLDAGISLATITSGFILSPEFRTTYGALDNTQFVTLLYANVLHRAADPAGLNGWLSVLNSGGTREGVVNGFSQSPEFRLTSDTANYGAQVFRLYGATLDRAPDPVGFAGWTNVLSNNDTLDAIAAGFVNSLEFQTVYGALNNTQFVTLLYANVLDRAPDPAGLNGWLGVLAGGASRTSVVLGFSESSEYQVSTRAGYVAFSTSNFATSNDRLDGGAGDDLLVAGQGADTFVFTQGQGGTDHIYGLETIDHVSLLGFGYSSAAQAESHLTQVGADLVFADQGQTIIFHNFYLANFYDDIWGFG